MRRVCAPLDTSLAAIGGTPVEFEEGKKIVGTARKVGEATTMQNIGIIHST